MNHKTNWYGKSNLEEALTQKDRTKYMSSTTQLKDNNGVVTQYPLSSTIYDRNHEESWWSGDKLYGLHDYNKTQGEIAWLLSSQEGKGIVEKERLTELVNRLKLTSLETKDAMFLNLYALALGPEGKDIAIRLQEIIKNHVE